MAKKILFTLFIGAGLLAIICLFVAFVKASASGNAGNALLLGVGICVIASVGIMAYIITNAILAIWDNEFKKEKRKGGKKGE